MFGSTKLSILEDQQDRKISRSEFVRGILFSSND